VQFVSKIGAMSDQVGAGSAAQTRPTVASAAAKAVEQWVSRRKGDMASSGDAGGGR
jgi:hypothetical protein